MGELNTIDKELDTLDKIFKNFCKSEHDESGNYWNHKNEIGQITYPIIKSLLNNDECIDLSNRQECDKFLKVLNTLRNVDILNIENFSDNLLRELQRMLESNSDSSIYNGKNRYIYELIQNADDLKCNSDENKYTNLKITFISSDSNNSVPDRIVFEYDGNNFLPSDIVSITSYFNSSKNINSDNSQPEKKITSPQIGEKGIGFKSVFGIADKAIIESGNFAFYLTKDNTIVPHLLKNDVSVSNSEITSNTKITLELKERNSDFESAGRYWYDQFKNAYFDNKNSDGILKQNPILFLNHIHSLEVFYIENGNIEDSFDFHYEVLKTYKLPSFCLQISDKNELKKIKKDQIKVYLICGNKDEQEQSITCYRYSMNYSYSDEARKARYGDNSKKVEYKFVAIFPEDPFRPDDPEEIRGGMFYSYFPTDINISVPLLIQAPYRLNPSRGRIDSNGGDDWYVETNNVLREFIKQVYIDFATIKKEDILFYLPYFYGNDSFFISPDFDDVSNFANEFSLSNKKNEKYEINLLYEKIFRSDIKREFVTFDNLILFNWNSISRQRDLEPQIIQWLIKCNIFVNETSDFLFQYPENGINLNENVIENTLIQNNSNIFKNNNIISVEDICFQLFWSVISDNTLSIDDIEKFYSMIDKIYPKQDKAWKIFSDKISNYLQGVLGSSLRISEIAVYALCNNHQNIYDAVRNGLTDSVKNTKKLPMINISKLSRYSNSEDIKKWNSFFERIIKDKYKYVYLQTVLSEKYDDRECFQIDSEGYLQEEKGLFYLPFENALIINNFDSLECFAKSVFDDDWDRYITYRNSFKIDHFEFDLDDWENSNKNFCEQKNDQYELNRDNIQNIIKFSKGNDDFHFLYELIQNADDCKYPDSVSPELTISFNKSDLTLTYNEIGFSSDEVKKLSSIHQTTKKFDNPNTTGYMGLGFFSVFSVAQNVYYTSINSDPKSNNTIWRFGFDYHKGELKYLSQSDFDFVPEDIEGTKLVVMLNDGLIDTLWDKYFNKSEFLLRTFLCLKMIKKITVQKGNESIVVNIEDYNSERILYITEKNKKKKKYSFERIKKEIIFDSDDIINETDIMTETKEKMKCTTPVVSFYFPLNEKDVPFNYSEPDNNTDFDKRYCIYSGLPTEEFIDAPMIIDAPFIMNITREKVFDSADNTEKAWNNQIIKTIREGLVKIVNDKIASLKYEPGTFERIAYYRYLSPFILLSNSNAKWFDEEYYRNFISIPLIGGDIVVNDDIKDYKVYTADPFIHDIYKTRKGKEIIYYFLDNYTYLEKGFYLLDAGDEEQSLYADLLDVLNVDSDVDHQSVIIKSILEIMSNPENVSVKDNKDIFSSNMDILNCLYISLFKNKIDSAKYFYQLPIFPFVNKNDDIEYRSLSQIQDSDDKIKYCFSEEDKEIPFFYEIADKNNGDQNGNERDFSLFKLLRFITDSDSVNSNILEESIKYSVKYICELIGARLFDQESIYYQIFVDKINIILDKKEDFFKQIDVINHWGSYKKDIIKYNLNDDFALTKEYTDKYFICEWKDNAEKIIKKAKSISVVPEKYSELAEYLGFSNIKSEFEKNACESFVYCILNDLYIANDYFTSEQNETCISGLAEFYILRDVIKNDERDTSKAIDSLDKFVVGKISDQDGLIARNNKNFDDYINIINPLVKSNDEIIDWKNEAIFARFLWLVNNIQNDSDAQVLINNCKEIKQFWAKYFRKNPELWERFTKKELLEYAYIPLLTINGKVKYSKDCFVPDEGWNTLYDDLSSSDNGKSETVRFFRELDIVDEEYKEFAETIGVRGITDYYNEHLLEFLRTIIKESRLLFVDEGSGEGFIHFLLTSDSELSEVFNNDVIHKRIDYLPSPMREEVINQIIKDLIYFEEKKHSKDKDRNIISSDDLDSTDRLYVSGIHNWWEKYSSQIKIDEIKKKKFIYLFTINGTICDYDSCCVSKNSWDSVYSELTDELKRVLGLISLVTDEYKEFAKALDADDLVNKICNNINSSSSPMLDELEKIYNENESLGKKIYQILNKNDAIRNAMSLRKDQYHFLVSLEKPDIKTIVPVEKNMVRSREEVIIFERIWHWLKGNGKDFSIEYEKSYCNKIPDFYICMDGKEYYWEHLGFWGKDWYRAYNLSKLQHYKDVSKKNLPRLSFPEKMEFKYVDVEGKTHAVTGESFWEVTSSKEKLLEFLQTDPSELYDAIIAIYDENGKLNENVKQLEDQNDEPEG